MGPEEKQDDIVELDDQTAEEIARRILLKYRAAFEELAK